jgi:uncharacterized protein
MTGSLTPPTAVGIGLKPMHVQEILGAGAPLDFFEVHAENYLVAGGPFLRHLTQIRERFALSIHGVGLSIGGAGPLDRDHLDRLAALLRRFEPQWFSEHLAWSSHGGAFYNDLLPIPYNSAGLRRVCDHIDQTQERLGRRLLLENPSTYVTFAASTLDEGEFLAAVVQRTGCGLLLDVNNAYISAINHGRDPWDLIAALPPAAVGEIHLAGFAEDRDGAGDRLLIDTHGAPVAAAVWALYRRTLDHLCPRPTLIERDQAIPPLDVLIDEAARARSIMTAAMTPYPASTGARPWPRVSGQTADPLVAHPADDLLDRLADDLLDRLADDLLDRLAAALQDPARPLPPGLTTWNGSDPAVRFGVHRNTVAVSLTAALADTFPVTRQLAGERCFDSMARGFVAAAPPRSPVLTAYGDAFPDWIAEHAPTADQAYLPELARLELARVRAYHAAAAAPLTTTALAGYLANPQQLPGASVSLHPSLHVLDASDAIVSLWAAHQGSAPGAAVTDPRRPESALVLRAGDDALVVPLPGGAAACVAALAAGTTLGDAAAAGAARDPDFDLTQCLALLIRHGAIVAWHAPGDPEP